MTNSEKIDFLYSKFVSPNRSQTSVFNNQIWSQGDQIPTSLPEFDSNNEYIGVSGEVILKKYEYVRMLPVSGFPNAFSSSDVIDLVSFQNGFDVSYEYKFYSRASNGNYVPIPFGEGDYFFDHDTGVLFFPTGRTRLYNPSSLYVSFIKYVGKKGINVGSQFSGNPQYGPVGPTGPTGETGETGPTSEFSIRYKGSWSSSASYSKWNVVKYNSKFFISTSDSNTYLPLNGKYWQPFGLPQLSSSFNCPDDTYWVSPNFATGSGRFNNIESVFSDINSNALTDVTITLYPGEYQINDNIILRQSVNINIVSYGRVNVSFADESLSLIFSGNNTVEFRGHDLRFTNGNIRLVCSNLSITGGSLPNVVLVTTNMSDTSRLMCVNSEINDLLCYGSFASLRGTNVISGITMDEVSVVHLESCMIQARPQTDIDQYKINLVSAVTSGTPPGFGYENPSLLIKNSRILSNDAIFRSTIDPLYGFVFCTMGSSLYVTDSSTSFLDLSDQIDAFVFNTVVNTTYDDTKLQILNANGEFQTVDANFED
jgi:hypothetical protein